MKNTNDLKQMLLDEMDSLRKGETTVERANSIGKLASNLIYTIRVEIENKREEIKLIKKTGEIRASIDANSVTVPSLSFGARNGK